MKRVIFINIMMFKIVIFTCLEYFFEGFFEGRLFLYSGVFLQKQQNRSIICRDVSENKNYGVCNRESFL